MTVPDILKKVLDGPRRRPTRLQGHVRAARLLRPVPRDRLQLRQPADGRRGDLLLLHARRRRPHDGRGRHAAEPTPTCPAPRRSIYEAARRRRPRRGPDHRAGRRPRSSARARYTLWDHCFELPAQAPGGRPDDPATASQVGTVTHKLKVGGNDKLEIYDYPGEYAQRFDGVDPGGGDRPADLQKIFEDNKRTVGIRMQEEAAAGLVIQGAGDLPAVRQRATSSRSTSTSTPTARTS